jgi:hypothetical protein
MHQWTRMISIDWSAVAEALDAHGCAVLPQLLDTDACAQISALWQEELHFRSRIDMARHGFGRGEYRYLSYPLPEVIAAFRDQLYPPLAAIANRWAERLGWTRRFPPSHAAFLKECHAAGQVRPTPLILRYQPDDWNALHQDVYGEQVFPLQVAVLLSEPTRDFEGGEFVLTEQRPRMQSRPEVIPLTQGDAVVFPVRERPVSGSRGDYRVRMRHGVSRVRSGLRFTLGIIFHDAT